MLQTLENVGVRSVFEAFQAGFTRTKSQVQILYRPLTYDDGCTLRGKEVKRKPGQPLERLAGHTSQQALRLTTTLVR